MVIKKFIWAVSIMCFVSVSIAGPFYRPARKGSPPRPAPSRHLDRYAYLANSDKAKGLLETIHLIQLPGGGSLSLGGGAIFRVENIKEPRFGLTKYESNSDHQMNLELHGDLKLFNRTLRAFGQISYTKSWGSRLPIPIDESGLEIHQLFFDISANASDTTNVYLRIGRQEMTYGSGAFFATRAGQNVRSTYDGLRLHYSVARGLSLDVFAVHPVNNDDGSFSDDADENTDYYGIYATIPWVGKDFSQDFYVLGISRTDIKSSGFSGDENRYTFGTRLFGFLGKLDYSVDFAYQNGQFSGKDIEAWGVHSLFGWTFVNASWKPRIGLRADIASGDPNFHDQQVETFDAVYPSVGKMYGAGSYITWSNLIGVGPEIKVRPTDSFMLTTYVMGLWKEEKNDFAYMAGGRPIPGTAHTSSRYMGTSFVTNARWLVSEHTTIDFQYQYYEVGNVIQNASGEDAQYFAVKLYFLF